VGLLAFGAKILDAHDALRHGIIGMHSRQERMKPTCATAPLFPMRPAGFLLVAARSRHTMCRATVSSAFT